MRKFENLGAHVLGISVGLVAVFGVGTAQSLYATLSPDSQTTSLHSGDQIRIANGALTNEASALLKISANKALERGNRVAAVYDAGVFCNAVAKDVLVSNDSQVASASFDDTGAQVKVEDVMNSKEADQFCQALDRSSEQVIVASSDLQFLQGNSLERLERDTVGYIE